MKYTASKTRPQWDEMKSIPNSNVNVNQAFLKPQDDTVNTPLQSYLQQTEK